MRWVLFSISWLGIPASDWYSAVPQPSADPELMRTTWTDSLPEHFFVRMRDNGFVYIAKAFAQQPPFLAAVTKAASALPHAVVDVTPSLGTDWNGEPAVFFLIVLADGTPRDQLLNSTRRISRDIVRQVQPLEEWGVLPYFNIRTQVEHARLKEPMWA